MSQRDIIKYMENNNGKATIPELVDALDISRGTINEQLVKLRRNWDKVEKLGEATGFRGNYAVYKLVEK